jgi:hypothetical protein
MAGIEHCRPEQQRYGVAQHVKAFVEDVNNDAPDYFRFIAKKLLDEWRRAGAAAIHPTAEYVPESFDKTVLRSVPIAILCMVLDCRPRYGPSEQSLLKALTSSAGAIGYSTSEDDETPS